MSLSQPGSDFLDSPQVLCGHVDSCQAKRALAQREGREAESCVIDWPPSLPVRTESDPLAPTKLVWPRKLGSHMRSRPSWGC